MLIIIICLRYMKTLYLKSSKNINVKNLMPIIKNKRNMLIAIKGIRNVVHMLEMIWSSIGIKL